MNIRGVDFTSTPTRRKPVVCLRCWLDGDRLDVVERVEWSSLAGFEKSLGDEGPWLAGLDFPFGQSRRFIENIGWPTTWSGYVAHAAQMNRAEFRAELDAYRTPRAYGDREHHRVTDAAASGISPQKLYGVPVALMFHEGARLLLKSGATIPGLQQGDDERVVVEAYPGVLARHLIGRRSYKSDTRGKQDSAREDARREILDALCGGALQDSHGVIVQQSALTIVDPVEDVTGDVLDSLLCAVQAAWAWKQRARNYGMPSDTDVLEGWIAEPLLSTSAGAACAERGSG